MRRRIGRDRRRRLGAGHHPGPSSKRKSPAARWRRGHDSLRPHSVVPTYVLRQWRGVQKVVGITWCLDCYPPPAVRVPPKGMKRWMVERMGGYLHQRGVVVQDGETAPLITAGESRAAAGDRRPAHPAHRYASGVQRGGCRLRLHTESSGHRQFVSQRPRHGGGGRRHLPLLQTCPRAQRWPQVPQLVGSCSRKTQSPAQAVRPRSLRQTHAPPWQVRTSTWQSRPQPSQLRSSVWRSTQVLPQTVG